MEKKLPKNVRQIGNVSDNPKIYVEDYVDIFFGQLVEKAQEAPVGAFLIGDIHREEEQEFIFINGAVRMQDLEMKNKEVVLGEKTWRKGCEDCKKYFGNKTILGWFLVAQEVPMALNHNLTKVHEKLFSKKSRVFIMKDAIEKEEDYYVHKYNDLMKIGGHYIYYEKNMDMQDYMIATRRDMGATPSEDYEDYATKNFRDIINKKQENTKKPQGKGQYRFATGMMIVLVLAAVGVVAVNRYGGLEALPILNMGSQSEVSEEENLLALEEEQQVLVQEEIVEAEELIESEDDGVGETLVEGEIEESIEEESVEEEVIEDENIEEEVMQEVVEEEAELPQGDTEEVVLDLPETYTVQVGDTLVEICINRYGSMGKLDEICELNEMDVNDFIYVGQELLLP